MTYASHFHAEYYQLPLVLVGAIEYYDKALAMNQNDPDVLYNKGLALDQLGKYKKL
ncbi:MAG: tetratricopeptide repeat protein [Thermoproteota archaeon]|nr:tetratricopeptide repeat protein [Thermoproteota archaeon]